MIDRAADYAMLAVQGPLAREIVQADASAPLPGRMTVGRRVIGGVETLVAGTGYTGEDGVELLLAPDAAPAVWEALIRRGAKPAGLAARDTLRTEVCLPPLRQRPLDRARADRGRARLVLQGADRDSSVRRRCAPRARTRHRSSSSRSC